MTFRSAYWPVVFLGSLVACGGGDDSGGGRMVDGVPVQLQVSYPAGGTIFVGAAAQLEAREQMGDSTTRLAANVSWSSDTPAVATVSPTGLVSAAGAGEATISANSGNLQGSLRIRVFPNFGGTWRGSEVVTGCSDSGAFTGVCADAELPKAGDLFPHSSRFTQTEASVNAEVFEDSGEASTVTTTGTISVNGELQLLPAPLLPADPLVNAQLENWLTRADIPSRMTGSYQVSFTAPGVQGEVRVSVELRDVLKITAGSLSSIRGEPAAARAAARAVGKRLERLR